MAERWLDGVRWCAKEPRRSQVLMKSSSDFVLSLGADGERSLMQRK